MTIPLLRQLTWREIEARYRGSLLGVLWSVLTPLFMLAVFTFVFAVVLKTRWGATDASTLDFALIIFAGLTTFSLFSEVINRAPTLVTMQPNLVKKVVFPVELLPVVAFGSALFQATVAMVLLVCFQMAFGSGFHMAALLLPALLLPLSLFTLGLAWFLAALGVYVRDVGLMVQPIVLALMFLSPVFYPSTSLPEWFRPFAANNPLAYSIETVRDAVIFGTVPHLFYWLITLAAGIVTAALGFAFFQKTRKGFADVL